MLKPSNIELIKIVFACVFFFAILISVVYLTIKDKIGRKAIVSLLMGLIAIMAVLLGVVVDWGRLAATPTEQLQNNKHLKIVKAGKNLEIILEENPNMKLGSLRPEDLKEINFYNHIEKVEPFRITDRLPPNTSNIDLSPLPFNLSTNNYGGEYSNYSLTDDAGNVIYKGAIYRRQAEMVKLDDKYYLIAVVEVNHSLKGADEAYAKFAVCGVLPGIK